MQPRPLRLDIVSDTICPWCYVGKRQLAKALPVLAAEGLHFAMAWRPFQLNPDMPEEGVARQAYRTAKFGSLERSQALDAQVARAGTSVGLAFRHDRMVRTPNTVASHALLRLALETGGFALQDQVAESLFVAYFTQGADIGDLATLSAIADAAGMPGAEATLVDPGIRQAVRTEERAARQAGLDGVPSFLLEGHFLFSGAQPAEIMVQAIREACSALAAV